MVDSKLRIKKAIIDALVLTGVFLLTVVAYLFLKPTFAILDRRGVIAQIIGVTLIAVICFVAIFLHLRKKLNFYNVVFLLFIISIIIKWVYMLNTPYNARQYDTITSANDGHEAYAWILYTTGKLPTQVDGAGHLMYQFYHPPLNALVQAGFMHLMKPLLEMYNAITGSTFYDVNNMHTLYETTQILATTYMVITSYFGVKIIQNLPLKKNSSKLFGIVFLLFFPRLVQFSAQENNDVICVMFSFIAMYYTLKWWKEKSWFNILVIAFAIGLAMMAKLAAATVALATAFVFIFEFIKDVMSKNSKKILGICSQFVVFLLICAPIGLWFQIYAMTKFNQPLGYVFANLNDALSTADHNVFDRFINLFDFYDMSKDLYCNAFENYNIFGYLVKSSIFGEFSFWQGEGFAFLSIITNYLFILSTFYLFVVYLFKSKGENFKEKSFGLAILVSNALMMLYFNIKMPYGCTMDFRYIVPIIAGFSVMGALTYDKLTEEKNYLGYVSKGSYCLGIAMIISSSLFYLSCI